jgi:hypothetical protein
MNASRSAVRAARVARISSPRTLHATARRRDVENSPLSHNTKKTSGSGPWPLIIGLGGLLGGAYWYFSAAESDRIDRQKHELERRAAEPGRIAEEAKIRAQETAKDARLRVEESAQDARQKAEAKWAQTKDAASGAVDDAKARADALATSSREKYDEGKAAAGVYCSLLLAI